MLKPSPPTAPKQPPTRRRPRDHRHHHFRNHQLRNKAGAPTNSLRSAAVSDTFKAMTTVVDTLRRGWPRDTAVIAQCVRRIYEGLTTKHHSRHDLREALHVLSWAMDRCIDDASIVSGILDVLLAVDGLRARRAQSVAKGVLRAMRVHPSHGSIQAAALRFLRGYTIETKGRANDGNYSLFLTFCMEGGMEAIADSKRRTCDENLIERCSWIEEEFYRIAEEYLAPSFENASNEKYTSNIAGADSNVNWFTGRLGCFDDTNSDYDDRQADDQANSRTMIAKHSPPPSQKKRELTELTIAVSKLLMFRFQHLNSASDTMSSMDDDSRH